MTTYGTMVTIAAYPSVQVSAFSTPELSAGMKTLSLGWYCIDGSLGPDKVHDSYFLIF